MKASVLVSFVAVLLLAGCSPKAEPKAGPPGGPMGVPPPVKDQETRIKEAMAKLSPEDRALAEKQEYCPLMPKVRLGSKGVPTKLEIEGQTIFICCGMCKKSAARDPANVLAKYKEMNEKKDKPK